MTYTLHQGDCLSVLRTLEAESVQTCVTSPPYFALRDYGVDGQIGLEESPEAYVDKLVSVFREVRRVLADDGTLWLNLGDSYAGSSKGQGGVLNSPKQRSNQGSYFGAPLKTNNIDGLKNKDLIGIPWLVAFALRADGWYLRSDIIWNKPNPMPESVTDRPTKSHEYIFLLSKSATYYYDAEAIKEPSAESTLERGKYGWNGKVIIDSDSVERRAQPDPTDKMGERWCAPMRNKRDVWTVTTKPYPEAHFATFPPDLIEPCILAGTSEKGECPECGKAWVRVVEHILGDSESENRPKKTGGMGKGSTLSLSGHAGKGWAERGSRTISLGWEPQCDCGAEPVPQTVLDPFNGSGTTGAVAIKHHRRYVGIELNPAYLDLTRKRLSAVQPVLFPAAATE